MRKVFPDHWSFLVGEICLYSFVILIVTGLFLSQFFQPSLTQVEYHGGYVPLQGIRMSEAYASTMRISFDVRGGLLIRQMHHWAALIFVAAVLVHMMRVFFGGAFRKPRELNWIFGFVLLLLAMTESYLGNLLPDDVLSGTGLRVMNGLILSIPIVGTYVAIFLFGGEFPGVDYVARFNSLHIFLLPGIMAAVIAVHVIQVARQGHTQYAGPGRTAKNVVGSRFLPVYATKTVGFFFLMAGIVTVIAASFQINPIWTNGPFRPDQVSAGSQPDWYMGFADGLVRLMPGWEINLWGHTLVLGVFVPLLVFAAVLFSIGLYPFVESWVTRDTGEHHLLDRPRNQPVRTAVGASWISVYLLCLGAGGNDLMATHFHLAVEDITWTMRIGFFVVPAVVFVVTKRWAMGLQRKDRELVLHGRESGLIKRLPHGEYAEVHRPLTQARRHTLTAHHEDDPLVPEPTSPHGPATSATRTAQLRVRLSQAFYGRQARIPKPGKEEYRRTQRSHRQ